MANERRRSFSKNIANYMSLGNSGLGTLLNGLSAFTVHARIRYHTLSGAANDNKFLSVLEHAGNQGLSFGIDGTVSKLRAFARSVTTDAQQALTAGTALTAEVDYYAAVVVDIGGKTINLYLNGTLDGGPFSATFANATWTLGTPTSLDAVGSFDAPPPNTASQLDGLISDLAVWNVILSGADLTSLGSGSSPATINSGARIWHLPMYGQGSPEVSTTGSLNGTITGDVPVYPSITRERMRKS